MAEYCLCLINSNMVSELITRILPLLDLGHQFFWGNFFFSCSLQVDLLDLSLLKVDLLISKLVAG